MLERKALEITKKVEFKDNKNNDDELEELSQDSENYTEDKLSLFKEKEAKSSVDQDVE